MALGDPASNLLGGDGREVMYAQIGQPAGKGFEIAGIVLAGEGGEAALIAQMGEIRLQGIGECRGAQGLSPFSVRRRTRATSAPSWLRKTVPWSS